MIGNRQSRVKRTAFSPVESDDTTARDAKRARSGSVIPSEVEESLARCQPQTDATSPCSPICNLQSGI